MALERIVHGESSIGNADTNANASAARSPLAGMSAAPVSVEATCRKMQDIVHASQGEIGLNLILCGICQHIPYLRAIHRHSSMDVNLPHSALGSAGLAAMCVLESECQTTRHGRHCSRHSQ